MTPNMDFSSTKSIPPSAIYYRKAFHYATRTRDESIETWYMRLKTLAEPCLFGDMYDAFLLNKFVVDLKEDNSEQINGINLNNEWTLNILETTLNKEEQTNQNHVYIEEIFYQVKDEIINDDYDVSDKIDWNATVDNFDFVSLPVETELKRKKRKYTKRTGNDTNGGICTDSGQKHKGKTKKNTKVGKKESSFTNVLDTDRNLVEPKPKRKQQYRTPLRFFCESCPGRNFKYKSNLMQHMERYHIKSKSHVCYYCGKSFNVSMELNKHLRTHTGEKPFSCDMCPKRFSRSDKLKQHRDVHLGIKSHVCATCNKKYSQAYSLTLHKRSHSGERPYPCKFCEKRFTNSKSLTIHLKTHGIAT